MSIKKYNLNSIAELKLISRELFNFGAEVFFLKGDLGSGKTTFVSEFIKENLVSDSEKFEDLGVMSPTFSIVNEYRTKLKIITHADLYRLKKGDPEFEDLMHIVYESDYTFIEWPSKLEDQSILSNSFKTLEMDFRINSNQEREIIVKQLWV